MILVIGARSRLGAEAVRVLARSGQSVRVLARHAGAHLQLPGVETVVGDLADGDSLGRAMRGADRVLMATPPSPDTVAWTRHAVAAAMRAQVRLFVRCSMMGADPASPGVLMRGHGLSDVALAESGVPFVILRPNSCMQDCLAAILVSVDARGRFRASMGQVRVSMVDARDVAAAAHAVLAQPGHAGNAYVLTGPEALSYQDIADQLTKVLATRVTYVDSPPPASERAYAASGLDLWHSGALAEWDDHRRRSGRDGPASQVGDDLPRLIGRPACSLSQLIGETVVQP
ncbi:NAD(P)H-binding protein [Thermoactinospora rubra]|uniref:NmrA family NAD(P)-binding protein n=1 Tax=Thermoactinospora rubra TaxID=1088767 RepID=UPI000A111171|nr:NAD(P)H-binding protein [Thermoactinospora rubra]